MSKKVKKLIWIVVGIMAAGLLMHLSKNYLIPFIIKMHSGGAY